jgi:hypothetical protein
VERTADFDAKRFAGHALEGLRLTSGRPELQLRVAGRPHLKQIVVASIVELEAADERGVAAVQAFGQPQHGGQRAHGAPRAATQVAELLVAPLRSRLAMIPRDERDDLDLVGLEPAEIAVLD